MKRPLLAGLLVAVAALVGIPAIPSAAAQEPIPAPAPGLVASPTATDAATEPPLSGFHNGLFFLRDKSDVFRLYVMGRLHTDALTWLGPGVTSLGPDSALKTTLQIRRARAEFAGEFFQDWQWQVSIDAAPTSTDNPAARTASSTCAVNATTGANACSDATNPVEAPLQRPLLTDAFVNYGPSLYFNVQFGQYLLPFTMENRVSDNTTPFLERSLVARGLGAPFTRDIGAMVWGQDRNTTFYYAVGLYTGDGPSRTNADNRFDLVARAFTRPLAGQRGSLFDGVQIGISGRIGSRDPKLVGYDVPSLTTQGGYVFWKATYKDALDRTIHVVPSAEQGAIAGDVFLPIGVFDLTSEIVYAVTNTREAMDGYQLSPFTERTTRLSGYAFYAQVGAWVVGSRDLIGGGPSYGKPFHADLSTPQKTPTRGLQVLAKVERLHETYSGARGGSLDPKTPLGDVDVTSVAFGANFWATRHLRVGLNYSYYDFPSSEPVTPTTTGGPVQSANQRAVAPAQALAKGADDGARDGGHTLHELQLRVGVQF